MTTTTTIKTGVLVIGHGAAGTATAISAARAGAETILVERAGFPGGISATLPWLGFHDREYRQVVKGFADECVQTLARSGGSSNYVLDVKCGSLASIDNSSWKCLAMRLAEDAGVRVMFHTLFVDTIRESGADGDRIAGVVVEHKSGRQCILADVVVDCSGDGDVAARGGVEWQKGRTEDGLVQAPTLVFRLGGIDRAAFVEACKDRNLSYREWFNAEPSLWDKMIRRIDDVPAFVLGGFASLIEKARAAGDVDFPQTRVVGVKTHVPDEMLVVMTRVLGLDPTDVKSMSSAYSRVYGQIPGILSFFRSYVPGCSNVTIREIAPMLGVRESRRIMGDYVLNKDDLTSGRRFDDAVAMGAYHIDIHRPKGTWVESYNVRAYTIPYRSLIARGVDRLMMAGKCISATHEAIASTRVIPICMAEGQAAGIAAALASKEGISPRDVPVARLQQLLREAGAEFGESLGAADQQAIDEVGQLPFEEPETSGDEDEVSAAETAWV